MDGRVAAFCFTMKIIVNKNNTPKIVTKKLSSKVFQADGGKETRNDEDDDELELELDRILLLVVVCVDCEC
jgi:hypothetical protein